MKKMECPICKKKALFVGVHDDEGNYHGLVGCEYENDPWSGLSYALHHEGWGDCPLCTDGAYSIKARNLHCYRCQPKKTGGNAECG